MCLTHGTGGLAVLVSRERRGQPKSSLPALKRTERIQGNLQCPVHGHLHLLRETPGDPGQHGAKPAPQELSEETEHPKEESYSCETPEDLSLLFEKLDQFATSVDKQSH